MSSFICFIFIVFLKATILPQKAQGYYRGEINNFVIDTISVITDTGGVYDAALVET